MPRHSLREDLAEMHIHSSLLDLARRAEVVSSSIEGAAALALSGRESAERLKVAYQCLQVEPR